MLVLRHGISERTRDGNVVDPATYRARYAALLEREGVPFWPDAAWRDVVFGAAMVATIVLLALIVGPPALGKPPDPSILEAYPRPDWYFLWYFAVLALAPHHLETFIMVARAAAVRRRAPAARLLQQGRSGACGGGRGRALLVVFMWTTIVNFWVAGERADWSPDFTAPPLPASIVRSERPEVVEGARLFREKGCEFCHAVSGFGGRRGPELTDVRGPDEAARRSRRASPTADPTCPRTPAP